MVTFLECKYPGYRTRTKMNAQADATMALAVYFESAGEKLTKNSVLEQGKKYIPIDANNFEVSNYRVNRIVSILNQVHAKTLNIAGNGLYTMKNKYTQSDVDLFTYSLLKEVLDHKGLTTRIELIRSGGQTGFDESGIKAAMKLGINALVLAPLGWTFRDINGKDINDETAFKERFILSF
jgi:hypothetical protein